MPKTINLREAHQGFARCVREDQAGEEYVITRNGVPVARLCRLPSGGALTRAGASAFADACPHEEGLATRRRAARSRRTA